MWILKLLLLIIIPVAVSSFLFKNIRNIFAINLSISIGMISVVETILKRSQYSILQDINHISFSHSWIYMLSLIIVLLVCDFLANKFIKNLNDLSNLYVMFLSICMLILITFGHVTNLIYIISVILSIVLSICLYFRHITISFIEIRKHLKFILPTVGFYSFMMFFYFPNEIYFNNYREMHVGMGIYILGTILGFLLFSGAVVFLLHFLPEIICKIVCYSYFTMGILCYIQNNFINGSMTVMDGNKQVWSKASAILDISIWIVLIAIFAFIFIKFCRKSKFESIVSTVSVYISLILVVAFAYLLFTTEYKENYRLTTELEFELSPNNNTLIFVLDGFDTQYIDKILEKDKDFLSPLHDFTYYSNCTSNYAFTSFGVPYLLTGTKWPYDMHEVEYMDYAYENSTLLEDMYSNGASVGIYTDSDLVPIESKDFVVNCHAISESWNINLEDMINLTYKTSKYKSYPLFCKNHFFFSNYDFDGLINDSEVYDTSTDVTMYNSLSDKPLILNDNLQSAYRFYHMKGAHLPVNMDRNCQPKDAPDSEVSEQSMGAMKIVYEYLNQMKELGIYDNSTIIITADHGHNYQVEGYEYMLDEMDLEMHSNPILFCKPANQNQDVMIESSAPVSQTEIVQTIAESFGLNRAYSGEYALDDIDENSNRIRYMEYRRQEKGIIPYTKFEINGNARDWNNWSVVN